MNLDKIGMAHTLGGGHWICPTSLRLPTGLGERPRRVVGYDLRITGVRGAVYKTAALPLSYTGT